jgi:tetrahydromethanopterin S-methyltransferase subunit G
MSGDNDDRLDDLEQKVEEVNGKVEEVKQEVGGLRRIINEILDRLRSAGGHLGRAGKGDDEKK